MSKLDKCYAGLPAEGGPVSGNTWPCRLVEIVLEQQAMFLACWLLATAIGAQSVCQRLSGHHDLLHSGVQGLVLADEADHAACLLGDSTTKEGKTQHEKSVHKRRDTSPDPLPSCRGAQKNANLMTRASRALVSPRHLPSGRRWPNPQSTRAPGKALARILASSVSHVAR